MFLWRSFKKASWQSITVAFNNAFRIILKLNRRCSASAMCVNNNVNYIPEKRKFSGILCFRQQRSRRRPPRRPPRHPPRRPPRRHNFVRAINFEGLKLRSSNLTYVLVIQISRTSSITDIVVQSKMAAGGHFVQKFQKKKKLRIDLKWQEL